FHLLGFNCHDAHAECMSAAGDLRADAAKTDDEHGLALQLLSFAFCVLLLSRVLPESPAGPEWLFLTENVRLQSPLDFHPPCKCLIRRVRTMNPLQIRQCDLAGNQFRREVILDARVSALNPA